MREIYEGERKRERDETPSMRRHMRNNAHLKIGRKVKNVPCVCLRDLPRCNVHRMCLSMLLHLLIASQSSSNNDMILSYSTSLLDTWYWKINIIILKIYSMILFVSQIYTASNTSVCKRLPSAIDCLFTHNDFFVFISVKFTESYTSHYYLSIFNYIYL